MTAEAANVTFRPEDGFVPNVQVAQAIAVAVLSQIYGDQQIRSQTPFIATLNDGVWLLEGRIPTDRNRPYLGGNAKIRISKMTGEVLGVIHTK